MIFTIADGILALLVLIGAIVGLKRGFFNTVTKPLKIILAIALTVCFALPIIDAWTGPYFTNLIQAKIAEYITQNCPEITAINAAESLPSVLILCVRVFGIQLESISGEEIISQISSAIAMPTGRFVATAVTYLALFIIFRLVLWLLLLILGSVVSSGPLMVIDKILGLIFTVAISFVICCIIANIISFFANDFVGGFIYEFFKNLNPLSVILSF